MPRSTSQMRHVPNAGLLLLLCCAVASSQTPPERLQAKLEALHQKTEVPGVSAAVVLEDGSVLPLVVGVADRETRQPMAADALLMQGSVGKTYAAAVALH